MPHEPLKETVMSLWYDDVVSKPYGKIIYVQMTLAILVHGSWDPFGVP